MGKDKITGNHDQSADARVVALETVLVCGDKVAKVGEEVVDTLRVPQLIREVEGFDLSHVEEDGCGSIVSVFWAFEEERVALEVDRAMASDRKSLLRVREGETAGATGS